MKKWQKVARRKVYGFFPVWVIVLVGVTLVVFAIILGVVLAMLKKR
jgi:hypothetical protein